MSNEISNERLEQIASGKWDGVRGSDLDSIANELLALRNKKVRTMPRHEFAQMVNELRAVPSVQSKREIIVRILHAFNINPDKPE